MGTIEMLILFLSSCFSNRSCTFYCMPAKTLLLFFCNSSMALSECSLITAIQYSNESIAPPGADKSSTMHTAVVEMLNDVKGAANNADNILPPPKMLQIISKT